MATRTSNGTGGGNFSSGSSWVGGVAPNGTSDSIVVAAGDTITIPDAANVTVGNSPAAAGIVCTVNGNLTVGGGASGSLRVKGGLAFAAPGAFSGTGVLTVSAGASVILDGNGATAEQYTVFLPMISKIVTSGTTTGNRATFGSDVSGGGKAFSFAMDGTFLAGGHINASHCDFHDLGSASVNGFTCNFNQNIGGSGADWTFSLTDCTLTNCGTAALGTATQCDGSVISLVGCKTFDSLGTYAVTLNRAAAAVGGTYALTGNAFDAQVEILHPENLVNTGNYYALGLVEFGTTRPTVSGNLIRSISSGVGQQYTVIGDTIGNYFFGDGAITNWHTSIVSANATVTVDSNIFEAPLADAVGDLVIMGIPAGSQALAVTRNLVLANASGQSVGKLISVLSGSYTITAEHNTVCSTDVATNGESGVGVYGETYAGRAGVYSSIRANISFCPGSGNPGSIFLRGNQNTVSDAVANTAGSVNLNHNAGNNLINATGGGVFAVYAPGVIDIVNPAGGVAMFTVTTGIGTGDVHAATNFFDATRNLASWGQVQQGTGGTVAQALAVIAANPTLIADLIPWVQAGFRPSNAAYANATYPGDPTTTDAAGNPMDGTIGAMAYQSLNATTYTLTPPVSSAGRPGVASADFTVQCNGIPAAPVTITPNDGGDGGTFTPSSLLVSDAATHTFKYTAATIGSKIISCTNDGGLTDPVGVSYHAYSLTLLPGSSSVLPGGVATLTAHLDGGTPPPLAATTTGGTLSTATPTSGTPFTLTAQGSGSGTDTVTVTGPGGTTASAVVHYGAGITPSLYLLLFGGR